MSAEVEIAVEVRAVTAAAIKVFDGKREVWIPKSQITDYTDGPDEAPGFGTTSIFVSEWLANEKGLL